MSANLQRLRLDRRVLGAIELVDAGTGAPVRRPLALRSTAQLWRQRSGLIVIGAVADDPSRPAQPGLAALAEHRLAFDAPPATPPVGSVGVTFSVHDPAFEYQDTTVTLQLPRAPSPAAANSVLVPQVVLLSRTGAAPVSPNWTVYRATVMRAGLPVAGACVSLDAGTGANARSLRVLSDRTGQATLSLVDQPLFSLGNGGQLSRTVAVRVRVRLAPPSPPGPPPLADVQAELARLIGLAPALNVQRSLPTGTTTHELLSLPP